MRRRRPSKHFRSLTIALGLGAAIWLARQWWFGTMYLHQNGQGPIWTEAALADSHGLFRYGPGYAELFGPIVRLTPMDPEAALFTAMGLASLLVVACGYSLARTLGLARLSAAAVALGLAIAPIPTRLAGSESYFAIGLVLLTLAAATLARASHGTRVGSRRFVLGVLATGVLIAQAAVLHPLVWIPAATIPVVVYLQRGRWRERLRKTIVSTSFIAVCVALCAGQTLREVLQGTLGQQWAPETARASLTSQLPPALFWLLLAALTLAAASPRRTRRRALEVWVGGGLLGSLAWSTNLVAANSPWIAQAYLWLFAPALIALLAVGLRDLPRRPAAASLAASSVLWACLRAPELLQPTADGVELNAALNWRDQLAPGSEVLWLARADQRTLNLPLYMHFTSQRRPFVANQSLPQAHVGRARRSYYYRSSLCATPVGQNACHRFEARHVLEPLASWKLPPVASLPWLPLPNTPITVSLFEVKGVHSQNATHTPQGPPEPLASLKAEPASELPKPELASPPPTKKIVYPPIVQSRASPIKSDETVVLFPSLAQQGSDGRFWNIPIHGWIFEWEGDDFARNAALLPVQRLLSDDPGQAELVRQRARWFLVDNERGKTITVAIGPREVTAEVSARDGHFFAQATFSDEELRPHIQGNVVVMSAVMQPGDGRRFSGLIHLVPATGRLLISDIDDTIRDSHVTDKPELLRTTFLEPYRATSGMPDFLVRLARAPGTHLHFVSASPWQLYPLLVDFLGSHQLAQATFSFKRIRIKDLSVLELFADPESAKVATIEAVLQRFPQRAVILVGDSGERDPEVYGELARRNPAQIEHIYIRLAPGSSLDEARQATAFAGVAVSKWDVFTNPPPL